MRDDIDTTLHALANAGVMNIAPYKPGKPISEVIKEYGVTHITKMASNENPNGSSPKAIATLDAMHGDLVRYPDGKATILKAAISEHSGFDTESIIVGNGSDEILGLVGSVFLSADDEVIISKHSFEVYHIVAKAAGARICEVETYAEDHLDRPLGQNLDAMAAAITDHTKVIFIANPNNPTGGLLRQDELSAFLDQVPVSTLVVLDEAYYEYVDHPASQSALNWVHTYPNLIVTRTFSKLYGLAGLRIGYGIANPTLIDLMNRLRMPFNVNSIAQQAGAAALDDHEFVQYSIADNAKGRTWLTQSLRQRGITPLESHTNFLCMKMPYPGKAIFNALLYHGIIVRDLDSYHMPDYIRVTIGTMADNERFIDALDHVLMELANDA